MGIFKKSNQEATHDKSLLVISKKSNLFKSELWDKISQNIKDLLYISNEEPQNIKQGLAINISINLDTGEINSEEKLPDDPSTIYTKLPLFQTNENEIIEKLQYWPSFANISPKQRWTYINWLGDISRTIDPGFVFILYYGLERHLLIGNFKNAFDLIIELRKYHHNNSFRSYSLAGLLYSCVLRNEPSFMYKLKNEIEKGKWCNEELLIKYWLNEDITPHEFSSLVLGYTELNKRYIKGEIDIYTKKLAEIFNDKFNNNIFPLSQIIDINEVKKKRNIAYANYSFPEDVRFISTPMLIEDRKLKNMVSKIHNKCHEAVKNELRELRKNKAI